MCKHAWYAQQSQEQPGTASSCTGIPFAPGTNLVVRPVRHPVAPNGQPLIYNAAGPLLSLAFQHPLYVRRCALCFCSTFPPVQIWLACINTSACMRLPPRTTQTRSIRHINALQLKWSGPQGPWYQGKPMSPHYTSLSPSPSPGIVPEQLIRRHRLRGCAPAPCPSIPSHA